MFAWVSRLHPRTHTFPPPTGQGTRKEQLEGLQGADRDVEEGEREREIEREWQEEALVRVNFQGAAGRSLSAGFSDPG